MRQAYLLLAIIPHAQGFETFEPKAFELSALLDREAFAAVRDSFEEELASVKYVTNLKMSHFTLKRGGGVRGGAVREGRVRAERAARGKRERQGGGRAAERG